jgi:hypothetical protein
MIEAMSMHDYVTLVYGGLALLAVGIVVFLAYRGRRIAASVQTHTRREKRAATAQEQRYAPIVKRYIYATVAVTAVVQMLALSYFQTWGISTSITAIVLYASYKGSFLGRLLHGIWTCFVVFIGSICVLPLVVLLVRRGEQVRTLGGVPMLALSGCFVLVAVLQSMIFSRMMGRKK